MDTGDKLSSCQKSARLLLTLLLVEQLGKRFSCSKDGNKNNLALICQKISLWCDWGQKCREQWRKKRTTWPRLVSIQNRGVIYEQWSKILRARDCPSIVLSCDVLLVTLGEREREIQGEAAKPWIMGFPSSSAFITSQGDSLFQTWIIRKMSTV